MCISAGGRNTAVSGAIGPNNSSGLLIAAYRPISNLRFGAYADQNISTNKVGNAVSLGNNDPLLGVFGVWTQNPDGTGAELKVTAAYGQKNVTVSRQVFGTSEPGSGSSRLTSQGAQISAKYGFDIGSKLIVAPYIGLRYAQNYLSSYAEGLTPSVTAPLSYEALDARSTTALAGLGGSYRLNSQAGVFASAGMESDIKTSNSPYIGSGINGLAPINFNPNPVKNRPTVTLGAYFDPVRNQRIGITGIYRQEPYQSVSTTAIMATYAIGI